MFYHLCSIRVRHTFLSRGCGVHKIVRGLPMIYYRRRPGVLVAVAVGSCVDVAAAVSVAVGTVVWVLVSVGLVVGVTVDNAVSVGAGVVV